MRGDLTVKPFQIARIERAREALRKKHNYYRSQVSKSVKTSINKPWLKSSKTQDNFENSFKLSFYDHAKLKQRFCPPIASPQASFGNRTQLGFK